MTMLTRAGCDHGPGYWMRPPILLSAGGIEAVTIDAVTKASKVARTTPVSALQQLDSAACRHV